MRIIDLNPADYDAAARLITECLPSDMFFSVGDGSLPLRLVLRVDKERFARCVLADSGEIAGLIVWGPSISFSEALVVSAYSLFRWPLRVIVRSIELLRLSLAFWKGRHLTSGGSVEILTLVVGPSFRRMGLGKELLSQVNTSGIVARTLVSSGDAIELYVSNGFEIISQFMGRVYLKRGSGGK